MTRMRGRIRIETMVALTPCSISARPGCCSATRSRAIHSLRESGLEMAENLYWRLKNSVHEGPCASRIRRGSCRPGESCEGWAPWTNERVNTNYLNTFLWAFRISGDRRYFEALEEGVAYQECIDGGGDEQSLTDRLHFRRPLSEPSVNISSCDALSGAMTTRTRRVSCEDGGVSYRGRRCFSESEAMGPSSFTPWTGRPHGSTTIGCFRPPTRSLSRRSSKMTGSFSTARLCL